MAGQGGDLFRDQQSLGAKEPELGSGKAKAAVFAGRTPEQRAAQTERALESCRKSSLQLSSDQYIHVTS